MHFVLSSCVSGSSRWVFGHQAPEADDRPHQSFYRSFGFPLPAAQAGAKRKEQKAACFQGPRELQEEGLQSPSVERVGNLSEIESC